MRGVWVVLLGGLMAGALPCFAQTPPDTVLFEPVGDTRLQARSLDFGPDGALWAVYLDTWRLALGSNTWAMISEQAGDNILVLSPDTLVLTAATNIYRSIDGGASWEFAFDEGRALFEASPSGAYPGLLLSSTRFEGQGIAYSVDRGETWTMASVSPPSSWTAEALDFAEVIEGPNRGRLVAGSMNGVYLSDDGGQTWNASSLFQDGRYRVESVVLASNNRFYAALSDATLPGGQVYFSDEDGLTWHHAVTVPYPALLVAVPGPPEGDGAIYALQQGASVTGGGVDLYRSYDGVAWSLVGALPEDTAVRLVNDLQIGSDGRLYVGLIRPAEPGWIYRSTEPVVVANEPEAPLLLEATLRVYPNPARDHLTITGPSGTEAIVYDVLGRVVRRVRLGGGVAEVDVSSLAAGVYVVRAGSQSAVVTVRR